MAFDTAWRLLGHAADAEDAVQEALVDAFQLHRRRPVRNWGGLLRHLAARRAIDRLRTRRVMWPLDGDGESPASDRPDAAAIERDLADRLRTAVANLPDRERTAFALRFFGEMTNPEIAGVLQISADAVAMAVCKARAKLKEELDV